MNKRHPTNIIWTGAVLLAFLVTSLVVVPVHADVAPPESPPGTNIVPGTGSTQVRMVTETVTMTVLSQPGGNSPGQAKTEARFTMRNLGSVSEKIEVRFPLTFFDGRDNGFGDFSEITDIQIEVNGRRVTTRRIDGIYSAGGVGVSDRQVPWAAFDVVFPVEQDVSIIVRYTANGYGYEPFFVLRYVLETGAGWNGTIGSADIIVKLPYDASLKNVLIGEETGFSQTTPGAVLSGKEIRWHFEDFEPTADNNIEITLLQISVWRKVLEETDNLKRNPADGEAWGRLGKTYKEIVRQRAFRTDADGLEMYNLASQAYEKAVTLLPKDALWHYGYADLLWSHYNFNSYANPGQGYAELTQAADEIRKSLAIDPGNQDVLYLASDIAGMLPWAITETGNGYDYLILTATPTNVPPTVTETPAPELQPSATMHVPEITATIDPTRCAGQACNSVPTATSPANTGRVNNPLCGGALLIIPFLAGLLWVLKRR